MKLSVNNPNFSVILPVGCNANCEFCYWEKKTGLTLERFNDVCESLPEQFESITITGGEPTISNDLFKYIKIANKRFDKVVLNTNGYGLTKSIIESVDYVNLSRHHFDDNINSSYFNSNSVLTSLQIYNLSKYGDITLNCFLPKWFSGYEFINKYTEFAIKVNCKVAFRVEQGNLDLVLADNDDTLMYEHSCGVCIHRYHKINGVDVIFKYGLKETYTKNNIYELILQGDGKLTYDWVGNKEYKLKKQKNILRQSVCENTNGCGYSTGC